MYVRYRFRCNAIRDKNSLLPNTGWGILCNVIVKKRRSAIEIKL